MSKARLRERSAPAAAGSILADLAGEKGILIEYRLAGRFKYVFFLKNGVSCFNDDLVELSHSPWLLRLAAEVLRPGAAPGGRYLRADFSFRDGRFRLYRRRRAAAGPDPGRFLFKFENECRYNYHHEDFSDAEANRILCSAGVTAAFRSVRRPQGLFMRYGVLERIDGALKRQARGAAGLRRLNKAILGFMLSEARLAKKAGPVPARELLARIKRINFRLAFYNYLHSRMLRYAGEFADGAGRDRGGSQGRALAGALKELQELKDSVNSRFSLINSAYADRLARAERTFAGADVPAACRLSAADLERILAGKAPPPRPARAGTGAGTLELTARFPLKGRVVVGGSFSGRAALAPAAGRKAGNASSILVADFPDESLLPQVRAAGALITARGGPASPGAVLARKLGKPCLADVYGCTRILRDGDRILLRGGSVFRK